MQIDLWKNLGDVDMTIEKALESAIYTEAVTRILEENSDPRVYAIQSKKNSQVVNSINHLVRTLQTSQPNRQYNQKFLSRGARPKGHLCARG